MACIDGSITRDVQSFFDEMSIGRRANFAVDALVAAGVDRVVAWRHDLRQVHGRGASSCSKAKLCELGESDC